MPPRPHSTLCMGKIVMQQTAQGLGMRELCKKYRGWRQAIAEGFDILSRYSSEQPIPVVERSKARVCSRLLAGTAGSNPSGGRG